MIAVSPGPTPEPDPVGPAARPDDRRRESGHGRFTGRFRWLRPPTRFAWSVGVPVMLILAVLPQKVIHIRPGDTLWGLSRQYHTSVAELTRLNHLPSDTIYAGRTLIVPTPDEGTRTIAYRVRRGDTASEIASRHLVPLSRLAEVNNLRGRMVIYPGQVLRVPVTGRGRHTAPHRHYSPTVVDSARRHRAQLARRPDHSAAEIRRLVIRTARTLGVQPALAVAVARQESGLQMNVVSEADAIGVMQVLPSTGRWMARQVVRHPLDLLDPADNVLAGVALLRVLTRAAPLRQAIAGYYQGLASVRAHGMYPDTAHYVDNILALRQRFR